MKFRSGQQFPTKLCRCGVWMYHKPKPPNGIDDLATWEKPEVCTIGVDGYSWLYKILRGCNPSGDEFARRFMSKVTYFQRCGYKPFIVFDGAKLPAKETVDEKRQKIRARNLRKAKDAAITGDKTLEDRRLRYAASITHDHVFSVIKTLEVNNIRFVVAPYEADPQLAFLLLNKEIDVILTSDADLILYGCSRIIFDYEKHYYDYNSSRLKHSKQFWGFTDDMVLQACMLSGCDYLSNLPGVGLKAAIAALKDRKESMKSPSDYVKVIKSLKPNKVNEEEIFEYVISFTKAMKTYKHQLVYDPTTKTRVCLTHLPPDEDEDDHDLQRYIGPRVLLTSPDTYEDYANGRINPITNQRMAEVNSELHLKRKDSRISPEIVEESVKGFQQSVEEAINTTKEDDDQMRSYLTTSLAELSRRHTVLVDQRRLLKEISDEVNVKETSEALLKRLSESESDARESQSDSSQQDIESAELVFANNLILQLAAELATEESKVCMLEKDRNEPLLLVDRIGKRVGSLEEELKDSKKKLLISENVISHLKQDQGQADQQVLDLSYAKIESHSKTINELLQRIATETSIREDQTTKVNRKIDEYKVVISEMEAMNKLKEDIWNDDVGKLKVKIESKCKSFSDLSECLRALKVKKNGLSAQLETLQKEDYTKDDLIQELETRLNSLQAVHVGVRSLVDDVDKVNNELTLKMAELLSKH